MALRHALGARGHLFTQSLGRCRGLDLRTPTRPISLVDTTRSPISFVDAHFIETMPIDWRLTSLALAMALDDRCGVSQRDLLIVPASLVIML